MILVNLIKKEIIQFFRNKSDVIVMFLFPVIFIVVMGKSLDGLMREDKNIFKDKTIYYRVDSYIENDDKIQQFYDFMMYFQKSTNAKFIEMKDYNLATDGVNKNKAICFIDIKDNTINYFRNENKECTQSKILRNLYEQYARKYTFLRQTYKSNPQQMQKAMSYQINILLDEQGINKNEIDAYTYYTFAQLTLIILYISRITAISMYREKFLNTMTRMKVSSVNKFNIILSKVVLGIVIGVIQTMIVYFISTKFLDVEWGKNTGYIFMVLISFIIFSAVFGIFMSMIFSDEKSCYIANNILIIIMSFLGGAFVPMSLIKSIPITSFLAEIIPSYKTNISLLSLCYDLKATYYIDSIGICIFSSIIMIIIGNIVSKLKVGGSFD